MKYVERTAWGMDYKVMHENIEKMRKRHEQEIEKLQTNCKHKTISKCMPFAWAPAHISHCVKVCEFCGEELFTTAMEYRSEVFHKGDNPADFPIKHIKPDNWFECPQREDCHYYSMVKGINANII